MARVNAYLAEAARAAGLNVSAVLQAGLREELAATSIQAWYRAARAAVSATSVPSTLGSTTLRGVREDDFGA